MSYVENNKIKIDRDKKGFQIIHQISDKQNQLDYQIQENKNLKNVINLKRKVYQSKFKNLQKSISLLNRNIQTLKEEIKDKNRFEIRKQEFLEMQRKCIKFSVVYSKNEQHQYYYEFDIISPEILQYINNTDILAQKIDDWIIDIEFNNTSLEELFNKTISFFTKHPKQDISSSKNKLTLFNENNFKITVSLQTNKLTDKKPEQNNSNIFKEIIKNELNDIFLKMYQVVFLSPLVIDKSKLFMNCLKKFKNKIQTQINYYELKNILFEYLIQEFSQNSKQIFLKDDFTSPKKQLQLIVEINLIQKVLLSIFVIDDGYFINDMFYPDLESAQSSILENIHSFSL